MSPILSNILAITRFVPHGHCYLWNSPLVGLHVASDALIALAYYSIPITLVYFVRKRADLPYPGIFLLFGAFIVSCGTTHVMEIWTLWHPNYWESGMLKAITAAISLYTAIALISIIPKALTLTSPKQLKAEIADRKLAEAALRNSQLLLDGVLNSSLDGVMAFQSVRDESNNIVDFKWLLVNPAAEKIVGRTKNELLGKNMLEELPGNREEQLFDVYVRVVQTGEPAEHEFYYEHDGIKGWFQITVVKLDDGFALTFRDTSDRKQAEMNIAASLQEKEVLLKEIHHRVKNNLQIICSLLNLQSRSLKDPVTIELFKETQNRIKSMALIHEKLYQSKNFSKLNLAKYIHDLAHNLIRSYTNNHSAISLKTELHSDLVLDIDTVIPCGLIVNEIISNSIKYAFKSQEKGEIYVQAKSDDSQNLVLIISDNGVGLPVDFKLENSQTLGLQLVKNLINQLRGTFQINSPPGTQFTITLTRIKV